MIFLSISTEEERIIILKERCGGGRKNRDPEKYETSTAFVYEVTVNSTLCHITFMLYSSEQLITEKPFNKGFTKEKNLNRLSN